ncbi:MAG: rod shape-determining protein RodA [Bradymonadaceae bacterium]|nr:rod shape-determining protein RodA [Lujinxingiaceae bacterium]
MKRSEGLRGFFERVDWVLLGIVVLLSLLGVLNLHSAASTVGLSFHLAQSLWFLFGAVIIAVLALMDYRIFERWAYLFFFAVVGLLVLVMAIGTELNGSKRWINLGFFHMQPSELLKIAVILLAARFFQDRNQTESFSIRQLVMPFALVGGGVIFVLKQPDLGTSLVILAIFMTMVLFEGVRWSSLLVIVFAGCISLPLAWNFGLKEYQKDRVVSFLNLEADRYGQSWQVRQSIIAFGSGRVWGKGYVEGTQVQRGFVPEHESDFVAAIWGEEHGFVGMVFLLAVYLALIGWALRISHNARDRFGAHVGVGVAAMIFWHTLINLGMVTGLLPVVGLTLPLMSYGGSSLLTMLMGIGLLLNVSMRRGPMS